MIARLIWGILKDVFNLSAIPFSLKDFSEMWLHGKGPVPVKLLIFLFASFSWAIWTTRNGYREKLPKAPTDVVHIALSFMQRALGDKGGQSNSG